MPACALEPLAEMPTSVMLQGRAAVPYFGMARISGSPRRLPSQLERRGGGAQLGLYCPGPGVAASRIARSMAPHRGSVMWRWMVG